jgi:hypothetical protein
MEQASRRLAPSPNFVEAITDVEFADVCAKVTGSSFQFSAFVRAWIVHQVKELVNSPLHGFSRQ